MKKIFIQIFVVFCCFVGYGQNGTISFDFFTGTNLNAIPLPTEGNVPYVLSGEDFAIRINFSNISSFNVTVGEELSISTSNGNGWTVNGNIATYQTNQPSAAQIVNLVVRFKNGVTCNNKTTSVAVNNLTPKVVKARADKFLPGIIVTREFPSSTTIPNNQTVFYELDVRNGIPNSNSNMPDGSYNLEFEEIIVNHSPCVTLRTMQNSNYTIDVINSESFKIRKADETNFRINYNKGIELKFDLTYSCTSCQSGPIQNVQAELIRNSIEVLSNNSCPTSFITTINSNTVAGNLDCECQDCISNPEPIIVIENNINPIINERNCWKNCLALFTLGIHTTNIPNSNQNSIVFNIPIQARITNDYGFGYLDCNPAISTGDIEYRDGNGNVISSAEGNEHLIRQIRFNLDNQTSQSILINLTWNENHNIIPFTNTNINFSASLFSGNTQLAVGPFGHDLKDCSDGVDDLYLWKSRTGINSSVLYPDDEFYYTFYVGNNNNVENYFLTEIEDVISNKLLFISELGYYYGNDVSNITYITLNSGVTIAGSEVTVEEPSELNNNTLKIIFTNGGLQIPVNCSTSPNTRLLIRFKVKVNQNVYDSDVIDNEFKLDYIKSSGVFDDTSNNVRLTVGRSELFLPELFSKCSSSDVWLKTIEGGENEFIEVKEGDEIHFRLRLRNLGTVNAFVYSILNSKPGIGDSHVALENGNLVPRDSDFNIDYKCDEIIVHTNSLSNNEYQIDFSNSAYNVGRGDDIYESHNLSNNINFTVDNSCTEDSNWLRVKYFENEYFILGPGEFLDVYYTAIIGSGSENEIAYNSFSSKVKSFNDFFNSYNSNTIALKYNQASTCNPYDCIDCTSFDLVHDTKYLVSGWVKEEYPEKPHHQFKTFNQSTISVLFKDIQAVLLPDSEINFYPSGAIIDGWQRIVGEFTVPSDAEFIEINLNNISKVDPRDSYFDDVRILPSKANMKSFVYDQKTQKLMAELDENNYSTFYEYDQEGGLIRIKKETEKGVYTIQETRSSNVKKTDK